MLLLAAITAAPAAHAQSDWTSCAQEGEVCRFGGEALVRFGIEGRYAFRVARGRIFCDVDEFGDPAPNQRKQCQVSQGWRQDSRYRGWRDPNRAAAGEWVVCASEGEHCRVPGAARVRYGANGQYAYRDVAGGVRCVNEVFGDPAPDVAKQCDYSAAASPILPPAATGGLAWQGCAREEGHCRFLGPAIVRYGANGRYVYREAADGLACRNDSFGVDPAPNERKACELLRGSR
jgi:hypothetical protein